MSKICNNCGKTLFDSRLTDCSDKCLFETVSHAKSFSIDGKDVKLNEPFKGGHITRTYGNNPIPWIQVEMNRSMYLDEKWFDYEKLVIDKSRLASLNKMFDKSLDLFFDKISF